MERIIEPTRLQLEFGARIPRLILASSSPNRRKLLESCGCALTIYIPNTEEERDSNDPIKAMEKIVEGKFNAYKHSNIYNPDMVAIAADTLVLKDDMLLGKPRDIDDARCIMQLLSGKKQTVLTAVALHIPRKEDQIFIDSADVIFKELSNDYISWYLSTGEWKDAAGGYRLQMNGYKLIDSIDGDWTTVVGLPLKAILSRL